MTIPKYVKHAFRITFAIALILVFAKLLLFIFRCYHSSCQSSYIVYVVKDYLFPDDIVAERQHFTGLWKNWSADGELKSIQFLLNGQQYGMSMTFRGHHSISINAANGRYMEISGFRESEFMRGEIYFWDLIIKHGETDSGLMINADPNNGNVNSFEEYSAGQPYRGVYTDHGDGGSRKYFWNNKPIQEEEFKKVSADYLHELTDKMRKVSNNPNPFL